MFLLLAFAIDLGRLFYSYVAVENAAKEGAFFGARNPLCDDNANSSCGDPNNVIWHVENEAPNIGSGFTTSVACRDLAGTLVQPINNCLDGYTYQVTVTYPFQLITPILSAILGNTMTLHAEAQSTVISDAFDPAGRFLFVADQFNHRVLQFVMRPKSRSAVRVYGQSDFDAWGYDGSSLVSPVDGDERRLRPGRARGAGLGQDDGRRQRRRDHRGLHSG